MLLVLRLVLLVLPLAGLGLPLAGLGLPFFAFGDRFTVSLCFLGLYVCSKCSMGEYFKNHSSYSALMSSSVSC